MMPQFSGLRALELLKASGLEMPLIIVSGTIGEDTAVATMKLGAADYFLKDRLARFGQAVSHALEQSRMRRETRHFHEALKSSDVPERSDDVWGSSSAATGAARSGPAQDFWARVAAAPQRPPAHPGHPRGGADCVQGRRPHPMAPTAPTSAPRRPMATTSAPPRVSPRSTLIAARRTRAISTWSAS